MASRLVVAVLLGAGVTAAAREADACSPRPPGYSRRTVVPADGARNVPTNSGIIVKYTGWIARWPEPEVFLRPAGGDPIPMVKRHWIYRPVKTLKANTTYELLDRLPKIPCYEGSCFAKEYSVFARFTTGGSPDYAPPSAPGPITVNRRWWKCENSACCGPFRLVIADLSWKPATDTGGSFVLYEVRFPDKRILNRLMHYAGLTVYHTCSGRYTNGDPWDGAIETTGGVYTVRAVDLAGNVSWASTSVRVSLPCTRPPPDAGLRLDTRTARPDATPTLKPDARGGGKAGGGSSGGGCALEGGGGRLPAPMLLLLVLPALWAWRRL